MEKPKVGDFNTPLTNFGDATDLSNFQYDFDISQEQSFQPPHNSEKIPTQVSTASNHRRRSIKTPLSRTAVMNKTNFPLSAGGEFTPLLRNATRNSILKNRREIVEQTPASMKPGRLNNIPEDLSPIPTGASTYADSANGTYLANTPIQLTENSSADSTPIALQLQGNEGSNLLQDGKQLPLREQSSHMDKIEKENFALKLKIHFLEEVLDTNGSGNSEAAVKENTELKVDRITMQKELIRYRKTLNSAEKDIESYRQQLNELQQKMNDKNSHQGSHKKSSSTLRDMGNLNGGPDQQISKNQDTGQLRTLITDLEARLNDKVSALDDRETQIINLKEKLEKQDFELHKSRIAAENAQRRVIELEEKLILNKDFEILKESNKSLEQNLKESENEVENLKQERREILREKLRAETDLEHVQNEIANKSMNTKGLNKKMEQKVENLQNELENLREERSAYEANLAQKTLEGQNLENKLENLYGESLNREQSLKDTVHLLTKEKTQVTQERDALIAQYKSCQEDLQMMIEEKGSLQKEHNKLTNDSYCLQRDLDRSRINAKEFEENLKIFEIKAQNDLKDLKAKNNAEIERLSEELDNYRVKLQQRENLHDADQDKWKIEKCNFLSQIEKLQGKTSHLQKTIENLQGIEGSLSSKESQLRQALKSEIDRNREQETALNKKFNELGADIQAKQQTNADLTFELIKYKEELRSCQSEKNSLAEKIELLEDEVEVLQTNLDEETEEFNREKKSAKLESDKLRQQIQLIKSDLAIAESAALDARTEIDMYRKSMRAGDGSKEQLQSRLKELEEHLTRAQQEKNSIQDELSRVRSELFTAKGSIMDLENQKIDLNKQVIALSRQVASPTLGDEKKKVSNKMGNLRGDNQLTNGKLQAALELELENAATEKSRLESEIRCLQNTIKNSCYQTKLSAADDQTRKIDEQIRLENGSILSGINDKSQDELSIVKMDLKAAREKEARYAQREATQKSQIKSLKKEILELEGRVHDAEMLRFVSSSPNVHNGDLAQVNGLDVIRSQLATANQALRETRAQLKNIEKEAHQKLTSTNIDYQARIQAIESEKDEIESSLNRIQFAKDEIEVKYTASEAATARLRSKVERLEKALDAERQNSGEDRTIVLERKDLHEMLRESQAQVEALDIRARKQVNALAALTTSQKELKSQLKQAYEERMQWHKQATAYQEQLEEVQRRFQDAQKTWVMERKNLNRVVRFANVSPALSSDSSLLALTSKYEAREHHHVKEMRGISLQLQWANAKYRREEFFRAEAAFAKRFMAMQIALYEAW
ncbi:hypothetical protein similar to calmodulin-binding coil-coil protein [Blumeria hordei DH14]|uniref:Centrosomin N-terminal motif 1 domain-containing protein n=1 Tax=Blumeria graminis f. sp. hordei (strain DH14) TaxID=546991 RepID=N1J8A8_BLUG1|nr:hypothetical protein similar to calmodulin-binding coil-coil protein [Blumeria hordei DH14]